MKGKQINIKTEMRHVTHSWEISRHIKKSLVILGFAARRPKYIGVRVFWSYVDMEFS